jgi:hypothetical protein
MYGSCVRFEVFGTVITSGMQCCVLKCQDWCTTLHRVNSHKTEVSSSSLFQYFMFLKQLLGLFFSYLWSVHGPEDGAEFPVQHYSDSYFACCSLGTNKRTNDDDDFMLQRICGVSRKVAHFLAVHNKLFKFQHQRTPQNVSHHLLCHFTFSCLHLLYHSRQLHIAILMCTSVTMCILHTYKFQACNWDRQL